MISAASVKTACNLVKTFSNKQLESKIFDKMDILEKKVDTVLIRDLLAANAALDDIKAVGRGTPDQIAHIRKLYMGNTGLPLDQKTYGIENSKIVAASYLGLLQIGIIQGEDERMLCRYILHMFATGEVIVYKELLNSFYRSNYANICSGCVTEAERRKRDWKEEKKLIEEYKRKRAPAELAGKVTTKIVMNIMGIESFIPLGMTKRRDLGASDECKAYVQQQIELQRDRSISETCAKKAKEQLNQKDIFLLK